MIVISTFLWIEKLEPLLDENKGLTEKVADHEAELEKCLRKG